MSSVGSNFHDQIAELCFKQYESLPKSGKPNENEWTILSCIVSEKAGNFEVVSLGTGTKCIGQNKMSKDGDVLNDSHAEIVCRRAFLRYLYENMLSHKNTVVKYDPDTQIFRVKEYKFHFFSTHIPCGDAAIFAKQDNEYFGKLISDNSLKRHLVDEDSVESKKMKLDESNKDDIFRTGAKCIKGDAKQDLQLQGADYHVTGVVRTKPGRGIPTLSVSCSDKIAKWSHLGIQGALLSILLYSPIYFSSITIAGGTPYNEEALKRALFGRLENVNLQHPYHKKEIIFGQSNLKFLYRKLEEKNPCPSSIVWWPNENNPRGQTEISVDGRRQGVTKKQAKLVGALRICKLQLFKQFIQVIKQFGIELKNVGDLKELNYKQAKLSAENYQKAWSSLKKSFMTWTVKSDDLSQFSLALELNKDK